MTHEQITQAIATAFSEAHTFNLPITIAIVDTGGHLLALQRMEGCSYFSIEASQKKAITASQLKSPTHILADIGNKVPELQKAFDKNLSILTLAGGFPIFLDGKVVGGLGISGGDFNQDKHIGEKAVQAMM
jgi:uncharacterized protein GlcG (DUF336 family)